MKVLVLNSGSSSIKYQLFNMEDESVLARGIVERIGIADSFLEQENIEGEEILWQEDVPDHSRGISLVIDALQDEEKGVLKDMDEINALGHRVVHGGEKFADSVLITSEVVEKIEEVSDLAPLHNPPNLAGIKECQKLMPDKPQVGVFDTAFHQTMPEEAYIYALPYEYYQKYGIRRYGFHGTSHKFVSRRAAELMDKNLEELKIITCHLGNGASVAAVDRGRSVDTSMGLTPLEGLVMGTRCGDIDPAIVPFLQKKEGLEPEEVDSIMNKESGLLGISGISNDSRDVSEAAQQGNKRARLAEKVFNYRVKKYIGAYAAAMGGTDAIVFTAGIGENDGAIRAAILENLEFLGFKLDESKNNARGAEVEISTPGSRVKVFVIPTNEELVIARDTAKIVEARE